MPASISGILSLIAVAPVSLVLLFYAYRCLPAAEATIEERILALHEKKRALVDGLLEDGEAVKRFSVAELAALLEEG